MAIISRRPIRLAILLYEQFLHLTQINLHPNTQLLSTQQHAYQSFLVTSWFDTVCVFLDCWVNFKEKHLHEHKLQFSDYNVQYESIFAQKENISGRKIFFCNFGFKIVHGKKQKL